MFADLSPADLRALLVEALTWWLALPTPAGDEPAPGAEDAVLGACRSLVKVRHGVWLSKVAAGRRLADAGVDRPYLDRTIHRGAPGWRASERCRGPRIPASVFSTEIRSWAARRREHWRLTEVVQSLAAGAGQ